MVELYLHSLIFLRGIVLNYIIKCKNNGVKCKVVPVLN
jgi:hypothetical protein